MRRTGRYTEADFRRIASYRQSIPAATMVRLREIPGEAEVEISAAMVEHYR